MNKASPRVAALDEVASAAKSGGRAVPGGGAPARTLPARLGRFHLAVRLASGGFGDVFLARGHGGIDAFQRYFAVKVVRPHLAEDPDFVAMFLDEVRIASGLHHPNICSVIDAGQHEGTYYLAMEYVMGEPLTALARAMASPDAPLCRRDRMRVAAEVVRQAAAGLHAAHRACSPDGAPLDIVHRDVSPPNLFVGLDGRVTVLDFGIAKFTGRSTQTQTGLVKGHLPYVAPEQFQGQTSRASDLWALGTILHELLAERRLFAGPTDVETMHAVLIRPIPPMPDDVPPALVDLVGRLLEREPRQRLDDAAEVASELATFLGSQPVNLGDALALLLPDAHARHRELFAKADGLLKGSVSASLTPPATPVGSRSRSGVIATGEARARRRARTVGLATAGLLVAAIAGLGIGSMSRAGVTTDAPLASATETRPEVEVGRAPTPIEAPGVVPPEPTPTETSEVVETADDVLDDDGAPTGDAPTTPRRGRAIGPQRDRTPGTLFLSTPGNWAEVRERGTLLGETPGRFQLAPGRHTLRVTSGDGRTSRTITVVIPPGGTLQRSVTLTGS